MSIEGYDRKRALTDKLAGHCFDCRYYSFLLQYLADYLRFAVGCFSPGYVLIAALFPQKDNLDGIERVGLSFVASIAVASFLGLLINYTPWGIRLYPVLTSLAIFILATSIVTWYRWQRLAKVDRFTISFNLSLRGWGAQSLLNKTLSAILVVAILGVVGVVGYITLSPRVGERFTEFYLLGLEGEAKDYPTELKVGDEGKVTLVIVNWEHETVSYEVEVTINGTTNRVIGPLILEHGEKWESEVTLIPTAAGVNQKVNFLLYKQGRSKTYRSLQLWVDVVE